MKDELVNLIRLAALLGGLVCIVLFFVDSDTVLQQIAWGVLSTALFTFVRATGELS